MSLHIIILAAGKGTRMQSYLPKVLHKIANLPLLEHVLITAGKLNPAKIHVIYGDHGDLLRQTLAAYQVNWIPQVEQLGTAHAVMQALPFVQDASKILILYGDVPLIQPQTLTQLINQLPPNQGLSLLTANLADPTGLGRIIRNEFGNITAIIEHKDASPAEQQIQEINSGIMATTAQILNDYLAKIQTNNAQNEYYLTDIINMLAIDQRPITSITTTNHAEILGVNNKQQLAELERHHQLTLAKQLMQQGVTLLDPARFDLRGHLTAAQNVTIDINVIIEDQVTIGANTTIQANNCLKNSIIGNNVVIKPNCIIEGAMIADNCVIGPFARIRPGSQLQTGAHVGNFVELKNTTLGKHSKAGHLSYLGDAVIGDQVNIGAGTITCNYDGVNKYATIIEDQAFIGSNTALVAPVTIGKAATIGAGSVITANAAAEKLTLARGKQVTVDNWQRTTKKEK